MKLDNNCRTPIPVTFNCWKHHVGFIKNRIDVIRRKNISDQTLNKMLLIIGNSQMDIYLGNLQPKYVAREIIDKLNSIGVISSENYKSWLSGIGNDFKLLKISDDSVWTLRLGNQPERYIHIHPGRQSKHTVRVKALTLKTAIAVMIKLRKREVTSFDLAAINNIRKNFLGISPLKKLSFSSGLGKFINIFNQANN